MKYFFTIFFIGTTIVLGAQSYTSYFTGNSTNITTTPQGGVCLMGGASEHDGAMRWFLNRADGGDVLVLRASGSDGYQNYFYSELGVSINSVETIVFNQASAANDPDLHTKIEQAEAIWFAGGDQWNYISHWRNTPIASLINEAIQDRNIVIGGTSAGMAILGSHYFSAQNGTITSSAALSNPYDNRVQVDSTSFLQVPFLEGVVTDTHYDAPVRKGRHLVFLARALTDYGIEARGIACNEYTGVCIDENGLARVFGEYPTFPEAAFFLQVNCELSDFSPENCSPNNPLQWNRDGAAVKVYKAFGTSDGTNTFDLSDWKTGNGGTWEHWSASLGFFIDGSGTPINCTVVSVEELVDEVRITISPNPIQGRFNLEATQEIRSVKIFDIKGKLLLSKEQLSGTSLQVDSTHLPSGVLYLEVQTKSGATQQKIIKQ